MPGQTSAPPVFCAHVAGYRIEITSRHRGTVRAAPSAVLPSADITRELLRLRRQLVLIYVVVIAGSLFTLERVLRGVPGHTTRFFLAWIGVLGASLVAIMLGRRIRARMAVLIARF